MNNLTTSQHGNRINLIISSELAKTLNEWAEKLNVSLSEIGRKALNDFVEKLERDKLEREIADACKFYYGQDKQIADEWKSAESRVE